MSGATLAGSYGAAAMSGEARRARTSFFMREILMEHELLDTIRAMKAELGDAIITPEALRPIADGWARSALPPVSRWSTMTAPRQGCTTWIVRIRWRCHRLF